MKKSIYTLALVASASLLACGRPSTSNFFELDGIGDPNQPIVGNPLPGKYGGNITLANWDLLSPTYIQGVFGVSIDSSLQINQAYFNNKDISGLGGWDLISLAIPQPLRLASNDIARCYMDPDAFPLLGGPLVAADVGENFELHFGGDNFRSRRDDDEDVAADDILIYFSDIQDGQTGDFLHNPYDVDVDLEWEGGSLSGFDRAPALGRTEVLRYPQDIAPTINNVPISADLVEEDTEYEIEWVNESGASDDLVGTEIVLTVYGPANLGTTAKFDVAADNPFFNRLARMVCLVRDDQETFTVFQSGIDQTMVDAGEASPFSVDDLVDLAMATGKYEFSSEDVNGNATLDTRAGVGLPPTPFVEDGNDNGIIDKLYGIALTVNRRSERENFINFGGGRDARILVSGNNLKMTKMATYSAPGQCGNGLDDDGDGEADEVDSACDDRFDNDEVAQCSNGRDDDDDDLEDFGADAANDPQCTSAQDDDESS